MVCGHAEFLISLAGQNHLGFDSRELVEVGGIEPQTRYVAQGLKWHCGQIVTGFNNQFWDSSLRCLRFESSRDK